MELHPIANEGNFHWKAESQQAGPYHVGWTHFMFGRRSFGTRGIKTHVGGTISQKEAFRQSKAAFECCRHFVQVLCCGIAPEPQRGIDVINLAAKCARDEYKRWAHQFGAYSGSEGGYINAVLDRFEAAVKDLCCAA